MYQFPRRYVTLQKGLNTNEVRTCFPIFLAFVDCNGQQIPRLVDKNGRKMYYSLGENKRHTVKNYLVVNRPDIIIHKFGHKKGRRHDYYI